MPQNLSAASFFDKKGNTNILQPERKSTVFAQYLMFYGLILTSKIYFMKKMIMPVLVMSLALMSCKKSENTETAVSTTDSTATAMVTKDTATAATGDTTANSVDWAGTYAGTLPCASCPGIETQLTLNNDKTYTLESNYLEEKDGKFTDKGTFTFSDDGSFITLKDAKKADENRVFFVGEGKVWIAEKVGDRSMKKDYQLVKQ